MSQPYALGTFLNEDGSSYTGVVREGRVLPLALLLPQAPTNLADIFANWARWEEALFEAMAAAPQQGWLHEPAVRATLPYMPEALLGAGANYRRHVIELIVDKGVGGVAHLSPDERRRYGEDLMDKRAESGKPFMFVASRVAIAGPDAELVIPKDCDQTDWELELAVVIGKAARRTPRESALDHVAGYLIANDITARDRVDRPDVPQMGMDWMACKNAPGFKILGPYITPARFVDDPQALHIRLSLNGQVMQDEGTEDMIFNVARVIEFASAHTLLRPGDIVMTGSPSGNGTHYDRFLRDGDEMIGEIDGLVGVQVVRCQGEI